MLNVYSPIRTKTLLISKVYTFSLIVNRSDLPTVRGVVLLLHPKAYSLSSIVMF